MEDTIKIRKDRIKNIAIIFLAVMLVLTFFSNSIMNFSLPEVATQYVQSGTITEKIRGTGNVVAEDPYKLVVKESRVIESVLVQKGDEVEKDQVIFKLEEDDSDELAKAEAELEALNFAFAQKILSGDLSAASFGYAQNGTEFSISQYQQRIQAANDKLTAAQNNVNTWTNNVNAIQKQIDLLSNKVVDTTNEQNAVTNANKALIDANKNLDLANNELQYLLDTTTVSANETEPDNIIAAREKVKNAKNKVAECEAALANAQANLDKVTKSNTTEIDKASLNTQLTEAKASLTKATADLEAAKTEQAEVVKDVQAEVDLGNQNSLIADKREEVEKLREKSIGAEIKAPVSGTIIEITKAAGETTVPEEALATIQVAGRGFSLSFSVTNEQAKKVQIGDVADLQNSWYYEDVKAMLSKIQPDTDDPGKKKLLVFSIEGSVTDGESLGLSIGQRSSDYDRIVPNSAIREDNSGKFILIIEEKTTPFGNRYKAKRVDVDVLASDDKNTAITADLEGYEYVITTSNKPVEAGKQVRLSDN